MTIICSKFTEEQPCDAKVWFVNKVALQLYWNCKDKKTMKRPWITKGILKAIENVLEPKNATKKTGIAQPTQVLLEFS